jgi:hypothetical protein
MRLKFLFLMALIIVGVNIKGQEINCNIRVNPPRTMSTSTQFYQDMERALFEFVNSNSWTNNKYESIERIDCSILINISSYSGSRYTATIQVISNRPVFGTNLQSPMFSYKEYDNQFEFEYLTNQNLVFNENRHTSNLTSVLAFYIYIIIGLDYDSFSLNGGTEYFQKAQKILNNAQSSNDKGWRVMDAKKLDNRYYLIENLLNPKYAAFRRALYRYHRMGVDVMADKLDIGRNEIFESLKLFQKVFRTNPNLFINKLFFDVKYTEIINLYSGAFAAEKARVLVILKEVDPAHINDYGKLSVTDEN